ISVLQGCGRELRRWSLKAGYDTIIDRDIVLCNSDIFYERISRDWPDRFVMVEPFVVCGKCLIAPDDGLVCLLGGVWDVEE
ncbi:26735_t:CDS:2, partial [Racocetra persica]